MNHDVLQEMFSDVSPETGYENLPFYEAGLSQEANSLFEDEYMGESFPESGMNGSFESLFENDAFPEWEDESGGLFETTFASEWEFEGGFVQELDREFDYAAQQEGDMFFKRLARGAHNLVRNPKFQAIAKAAARGALGGAINAGSTAFPMFKPFARPLTNLVNQVLKEVDVAGRIASAEGFYEDEAYFEIVQEIQSEGNPMTRAYAEAMMEHLGVIAAESESEEEASAFIAPLIPLAAKALPAAIKMVPGVMSATAKLAPVVMKGIENVGKSLLSHPDTKKMVNSLPSIAKDTVTDIARHVAKTGSITENQALRYLAKETAKNLSSPQKLVQNYQKAKAGSRRYTQARRQLQAKQGGTGIAGTGRMPTSGATTPRMTSGRPHNPTYPQRPQGMAICCNCGCHRRR
jgi:hypothetical protein